MFKRLFLSTIAVLVSLCVFAQENDAPSRPSRSKTVEVEGIGKSELYNRATTLFLANPIRYKLEVQDKEAGVVAGTGTMECGSYLLGCIDYQLHCQFAFHIALEDGKYDYRIEQVTDENTRKTTTPFPSMSPLAAVAHRIDWAMQHPSTDNN